MRQILKIRFKVNSRLESKYQPSITKNTGARYIKISTKLKSILRLSLLLITKIKLREAHSFARGHVDVVQDLEKFSGSLAPSLVTILISSFIVVWRLRDGIWGSDISERLEEGKMTEELVSHFEVKKCCCFHLSRCVVVYLLLTKNMRWTEQQNCP